MPSVVPSIVDLRARLVPGGPGPEAILQAMERNGIERAALVADAAGPERLGRHLARHEYTADDADHDAVLAACALAPERLEPVWLANPHRGPQRYRERSAEFRGMELSPATHGIALTDWTVTRLIELAAQAGHHVYAACLDRPGCTVEALMVQARRFPEVTFVLGGGGPATTSGHAVAEIAEQGNVLLDGSSCSAMTLRAALRGLGSGRIVFASQYPYHEHQVELARFAAAGMSSHEWADIMWHNTSRLLPARVPLSVACGG